jgi:hypothetical protein
VSLNTEQVLWTVLVLMLALLLPLVPTVVIYWLFPEGNVTVKGPLNPILAKNRRDCPQAAAFK